MVAVLLSTRPLSWKGSRILVRPREIQGDGGTTNQGSKLCRATSDLGCLCSTGYVRPGESIQDARTNGACPFLPMRRTKRSFLAMSFVLAVINARSGIELSLPGVQAVKARLSQQVANNGGWCSSILSNTEPDKVQDDA